MVGAGRESAHHTVEFIRRAANEGAQFVSVLAPHYFKGQMTDDALFAYYTWVADRSPVPVLIYNAPKFCGGLGTSFALIGRLAGHPNIVGMKDTSAEDIGSFVQAASGKDFFVLAGSISKYYDGLTKGAIGGVLSLANYLPQECCVIAQLFESGKTVQAKALSDKLITLTKACSDKTGIAGSKACMTLMGFAGGYPRLPLLGVSSEDIESARKAIKEAGYLK
jgi:4-hydroxy-2-oxoglutarate aldolase